jgi:hypothetical protein
VVGQFVPAWSLFSMVVPGQHLYVNASHEKVVLVVLALTGFVTGATVVGTGQLRPSWVLFF